MAVLLAVALFSVMLANGLSASPQHSRYLGLDLLLDAELLLDPGLGLLLLLLLPACPRFPDFIDSLPPALLLPFLAPPLLLVFSYKTKPISVFQSAPKITEIPKLSGLCTLKLLPNKKVFERKLFESFENCQI